TRWLTPTLYSNPDQVSAEESLPEWNTALWMRQAFPSTQGEIVWVGKAASIPYLPGTGGGIQFMASSSSVLIGGPWIPTISALLRLPAL
ncbi:hypothetical protein J2P12_07880, partial [Candidatus Bathyarchaeota archaeon]|nr:hypothetical protein [Candidatus Bathyarchaeota archaeon]